jgi:hypothetical protein
VKSIRNFCSVNAPIRKLNRRAASLPLASLVSLDSFALPYTATGGGKTTSPTGKAGRDDYN